mmetsp:Transcript_47191/g.119438  ORF Transcript_47191/g.119438 Transcript_47191/m.119438 type:complete len:228 (-) Transcript_47191:386-1069(-)
MRIMAPANSRDTSTTLRRSSIPTSRKRWSGPVRLTLLVTTIHCKLQLCTSSRTTEAALPEKKPCEATAYNLALGAKSCKALHTSARLPQVSNMSSTTITDLIVSSRSEDMIFKSPLPPALGRIRSTIIKPMPSSVAIRRVIPMPPPLVAQTKALSASKPSTFSRMKLARYLLALNSSSTVLPGANPTSASLCKSTVRKRSAPAVFKQRNISVAAMPSPADDLRSCRA